MIDSKECLYVYMREFIVCLSVRVNTSKRKVCLCVWLIKSDRELLRVCVCQCGEERERERERGGMGDWPFKLTDI